MLILLIFHVYYGNKTVSEYFYSRQVSVGICEVKATLRQPPFRRGSVFDFPDRRKNMGSLFCRQNGLGVMV